MHITLYAVMSIRAFQRAHTSANHFHCTKRIGIRKWNFFVCIFQLAFVERCLSSRVDDMVWHGTFPHFLALFTSIFTCSMLMSPREATHRNTKGLHWSAIQPNDKYAFRISEFGPSEKTTCHAVSAQDRLTNGNNNHNGNSDKETVPPFFPTKTQFLNYHMNV